MAIRNSCRSPAYSDRCHVQNEECLLSCPGAYVVEESGFY